MNPIPKEVLDAAKVIGRVAGCDPQYIISSPDLFNDEYVFAQRWLEAKHLPRTHSRWIRLNAAAETLRAWFAKDET